MFVVFFGVSSEAWATNNAPTMNGYLGNRNVTVNDTISVNLSVYFNDADEGDTLTYSHTNPSPNLVTLSLVGTHTLRIIAGDTPGTSHKIVVTATDTGGLSAQQDFTVTVNAEPTPDPIQLSVSPTSISEGAGATSVTVTVIPGGNSSYDVNQTISVSFQGSGGVGYSASAFTFTMEAGDMSARSTFTLTPLDDRKDKSNGTVTVTASASPSGGSDTATITLTDDDTRGLVFSGTPVDVDEDGGTDTYRVKLATMPTGAVTVSLSTSGDTSAASLSESTLSFTTTNWNTAQEVTVTGENDDVDNAGDMRELTISHSASGGDYGSVSGSVDVDVDDDDTRGLVFLDVPVDVDEDGGTDKYSVKLATEPTGTVRVRVTSNTTSAARVSPSSLTFTDEDWDDSQEVTVTGVNDDIDNAGDVRELTISHSASGGDYGSVSGSVDVDVDDDDTRGLVFLDVPVDVDEDGGTDKYSVKLATEPTGTVRVRVTSNTTSAARVSPSSLTFTDDDWDDTQEVTVTGVNDDIDNVGDVRELTISHSASGGDYGSVSGSVDVDVDDDDTRGLVFSGTPVDVDEDGGTDTYRVRLATEPTGTVRVRVTSNTTSAATVNKGSLSFTTSNWDDFQSVTVTGVNDDIDNVGDVRELTISHSASGGDYGSVSGSVDVDVDDDDTRGLVFSGTPVDVDEDGGTDTYRVRLATEPTGTVRVRVTSNTTSAATVNKGSLSFTTSNWDDFQSVTVTGVNDDIDNVGDVRELTISHSASGGDYGSVSGSVDVDVDDDDTRGLVFSGTPVDVDEDGGTDTYRVRLATEPTGTVRVRVTSNTTSAATVNKGSLSFTTSNWDDFQSVTVTGVNDDIDNAGDVRELTISHSASGGDYGSVSGSVDVDVDDDDTRGLVFSGTPVDVDEDGGTDTYWVRLATEPTGTVRVRVTSNTTSAATANKGSLSFTTLNWDTVQEVTVTGVNDDKDNSGDKRTVTVSHSASGGDYAVVTGDVAVTVTDDDTRGLVFSGTPVEVAEDGGTDTYSVKLSTMPTAPVTVTLASSNTGDATLNKSSLSFTTTNWGTAQEITVTGVNDEIANSAGRREVTIAHTASGGDYAGVTGDVAVTVTDDDTRGLVFSGTPVDVAEDGGTDTYSVKLSTMPTAPVTVTLASSNTGDATLNKSSLSFTTTNWGTAQEITVTGVNDEIANSAGRREVTIAHTASGGDYAGVTGDVAVTVTDDETRGLVFTGTPVEVDEDGGTGTYSVKLSTMPTAPVTVTLASSNTGDATLNKSSLSFTTTNWGTAQEITVTGVNDDKDNSGDERTVTVSHSASGGDYAGVTGDVAVTVTDDDTRGLVFSGTPVEVAEDGGTDTYSVTLSTMPTAPVTVTLASSNTGDATLNKSSLSFTTTNWGTAQEITVTGVNDEIANSAGRREVTIAHTASGGDYGSVTGSVAVTVRDDDSISTTPTSITLSVSPNQWLENAGNTTVTVTATPVGGTFDADQTVTVSVAGSDVTQAVGFTAVANFAVTISADSTSGSGSFSIAPLANSVVNVDETITISGTVSPSTALVTSASLALKDDDEPTSAPASPPGNATAASADGSLNLSWQPVAGATSYEFQYRKQGGAIPNPWPWTDAGSSTSYTIPDLENRMTYIIRVRGRNSFGPGPFVKLYGTPRPQGLLPAPENLVASSGNGWLRVSWSPVPGASSYQVQYRIQSGVIPDPWPWSATDSASRHTLTDLKNRTTYIVRVRAVNAMGMGGNISRVFGTPRVPPSPEVSIEAAESQVTEGASVGFTVSATPAPAESLTVNLSVSGGEAFLTGTIPTSVTILPGQTSASVTLLTEDDVVDETNSMVTVTVASGDGYSLAAVTSAQVSINDDDDTPTGIALSVLPRSVSEADSAAIVTVTASPTGGTRYATEQSVTVSVAGGGDANAVDFAPVDDFVVTIAAGAEKGSGTFELSPVDNTTSNTDETITISGTGPAGVSVTSATMTLTDDDVPVVTITAAADTVTEGASAAFTVAASPAPLTSLTVNILVSGGTGYLSDATPDSVIVIGAGNAIAVLSLVTDDDEADEANAVVTVSVKAGSGYVVGQDATARVVIKDDDLPEGAPSVPGNVRAMGGDRQVTLTWSAAARATWYEVQYRAMGAPIPDPWPWTNVGNVTRYTFDGLENGTTYKLRLRAMNESDSSRVVKIDGRTSGTSARKLAGTSAGAVPTVVNIPDDFTLEAGDSRTLDVTATFTGNELTYSVSSTDASVASATMMDGIMTVRGLTSGTAVLSVTARNGAGNAGYTLSVAVTPGAAERTAYENVLAAMGRGLLSSARATMEDRFSTIGVQHRLALAGRRVDGLETGVTALVSLAGYHIPRHWNDQISPVSAANVELLRSSSFIYTLPGYGSARGMGGVTIWGTGNVQAFRSSPSGLQYDGGLRTGFMGVDISTPGLVAGLSVSRTAGMAGFNTLGIQGDMSTRMTGVYPYARWRSAVRPLEIWSILGAGRGEAVAREESRNLSMRMAMMGLRAHWMDMAGLGLSVVGHAGLLSLTAPSQPEHVLGDLNASVRQARLGLEGSAAGFNLGASRITPFAQVAGRYDGGAGESGSGLEVAGGLRLDAGRLGVEARGRILAAHTASSYRERGLSFIAYLRPITDRGGLSVSLSPRWGHDTRAVDMTWKDDAVVATGGGYAEQAGAVRAQVGYSMRYPTLRGLVVTPFGEADLSATARRLMRIGTRMGSQEGMMSLELVGERRQDRTGDDHRVGLLARMRF